MTFGVWEFVVVILGFSCFSAGLIAHVLTPGVEPAASDGTWLRSGWNRHAVWLVKIVAAVLLLGVILSSLEQIKGQYPSMGRFLPGWLFGLSGAFRLSEVEVWTWLQRNEWIGMVSSDASLWFPAPGYPLAGLVVGGATALGQEFAAYTP